MDTQIRTAAFTWLEQLTLIHGDVLPWEILHKGFDFMGQRIVPIGATGIWKPKIIVYNQVISLVGPNMREGEGGII